MARASWLVAFAAALLLLPAAGPAVALDDVPGIPEVPAVPDVPGPPTWVPGLPAVPPALPAPDVQPPALPQVCAPVPDCAVAVVAPIVAQAEHAIGPWLDAFAPFVALLVPNTADALLLSGKGAATVTINNNTAACQGDSSVVLEASRKSLNLEPSITLGYSGALQEGGFLLPCFMGQRAQPSFRELQPGSVFPDGPWIAVKRSANHVWTISVSSADAHGVHHVHYTYKSPDGTNQATLDADLLDYR